MNEQAWLNLGEELMSIVVVLAVLGSLAYAWLDISRRERAQ